MQVEYAKNPRWVNAEKSMINLNVKFKELPMEVPFAATPNDPEPHGRQLFDDAKAGKYGPVAPYIPR